MEYTDQTDELIALLTDKYSDSIKQDPDNKIAVFIKNIINKKIKFLA